MTIPNHDRLFFEQLDRDQANEAHDEAMYDHEFERCYTEIIDTHEYEPHPAVKAAFMAQFNKTYESSPHTFEEWLDDTHAGEIADWCAEYHHITTQQNKESI